MNPDAPLANPYIGPSTFSYEQRHLFFGREREARDLLARVLSERLLLFYAQSGAGKSSLLNTRLIPQLEEDKGFVVLPVARVSGELPAGVAQVDNIFVYNLLLSIDEGDDPGRLAQVTLSDFLARLTRHTPSGHEHPARRGWAYDADATPAPPTPNGRRYALIIDQFEEIITSHPARWGEREDLFRQIDAAMQSDPNLWVVLTLREDYVAALDPYAALMSDRLRARFYMERMGVAAALEAIRRPAELAGRPFGPGVAQQLTDNLRQVRVAGQEATVAGQYVEPVQLQVVCYQLWENIKNRPSGLITTTDPAEAGDVDRALTQFFEETLAAALADPTAAGVSERQLRAWFDEQLITEAGTRGLVHQGESETGGLPNGVVQALQRRFLVRAEARGGDAWIELVHDRLVAPIRASNAAWFPQHLSALQRQAKLWDDEKRRDGLLLSGEALAEAEGWAAEHEKELEPHERDFLAACSEVQAQARREKEQVKRERRQSRWIRALAIAAAVVAILALIAAGSAWVLKQAAQAAVAASVAQKHRADEKAREAEEQRLFAVEQQKEALRQKEAAEGASRQAKAGELAAQAQTVLADRPASPDLALLLARRAITTTYGTDGYVTEQAREALVKAMAAVPPWKPFLADPERAFGWAFFAAGGTRLVTQESDGVVRLWDAATGTEIDHFESRPGSRVSIDDHYFVTYSDGKTYVRDTTDGKAIVELPGESYAGIIISPTMERIVTYDRSGTLWDAETQKALKELNIVSSVRFSPDSERLWFIDSDSRLHLFDAETGDELPLAASGDWVEITNRVVIVNSFDEGVDLRDAHTGEELHPFGEGVAIGDAKADAHDARIAVLSDKGGARVLDARTGKSLYAIAKSGVEEFKFSQSAEWLAVKLKDDGWRVLRAGDGSEVKTFMDAADIWFNQRDENIVVVDQEGAATVRSLDSSEPVELGDVGQDATVSFSEDGKRAAILGANNSIGVWDIATGNSIYAIGETKGDPESLNFSPDGRYVYTKNELWDSERQRKLFPDVELSWVAFSADGRLAILSGQNSSTVWEVTNYRQQMPLGADFVLIAFYQDGPNILTTDTDSEARLWNGATAEEIKYFPSTLPSDNRRFLIGANPDGDYALFDLATGEEKLSFGRASDFQYGWSSEDGRLAVVQDANGVAHLWDIERQEERFTLGKDTACAEFSRDGRFVGTPSEGELHVWSATERGPEILPPISVSNYSCVFYFSNDGRMLAVYVGDPESGESLYRIWNLQTGDEMLKDFAPFEEVEFSPDGAFILTKARNDAPRLWNAQTEQQVAADITDSVSSLCFVESAKPALVYDCDSAQKLWNLQSGEELALTENATAHVLSPDARWVVAFSATTPPRVWNLAEGKLRYSLPAGIDDGNAVFSPQGDFLAAADGKKGRAFVFAVETGNMIGELPIEEEQTVSALSPDDGLLVFGDEQGADVLDIGSQKKLWRFDTKDYRGIKFSPDSRYLVIDGKIWPATPAVLLELAAPLIQRQPAELTEGERREYGLE